MRMIISEFITESKKEVVKMKRTILKVLGISFLVLGCLVSSAYGADISASVDNSNVCAVTVTNNSQEGYEGLVAITAYTLEYVVEGVEHHKEIHDITYNADGLMDSQKEIEYISDELIKSTEMTFLYNENFIYPFFNACPYIPSGFTVVLHTFVKPPVASSWKVSDIVVSNISTDEILAVLDYTPTDTAQQLEAISQKLDAIDVKITNNGKNHLWYLKSIFNYVKAIWAKVSKK